VSVFALSCLIYLGIAVPGSTLGLLWPSMRVSIHEPLGALGIVLFAGVVASVIASAATGRALSRLSPGPLLALGTAAVGVALAVEAAAPALWVIVAGSAVFSLGFGAVNSALNVYAAGHFGARDINWMHASYGLGATLGPLLVTALLRYGATWRGAAGSMAAVVAVVAAILAVTWRRWADSPDAAADQFTRASPAAADRSEAPRRRSGLVAGVAFTAVETGIESAAGIWGYVFLTSGRGLPDAVAGIAVSAYWAMMFTGRGLLGPLAARLGASRVLAGAVASVPLGALLMTLPGPAPVAVAGMMALGLATAPIFPLLTLTTADRVGGGGAPTAVGLQVAASAVGSAGLPSGIGVLIGAVSAQALGPSLLVLSLAMACVYRLALRSPVTAVSGKGG
jgi:fucose permease